MNISINIAFYKNMDALTLILKALSKQSDQNFDVIIAEDNNANDTKTFVSDNCINYNFKITHIYQLKKDGFRKNQMLNRAINAAQGDAIIFIDGDCIPHKHFVKEYRNNISESHAYFGRRVMLSPELTNRLYTEQDLRNLRLFKLMGSKSKRIKYGLYLPFIKMEREQGILGCNWGILKKHLIEVNGYDEDYITAGAGEDNDIEWRLKLNGIKLISIRYSAIVYHLHHNENYTTNTVLANLETLKQKRAAGLIKCKNGLSKI